MSTEPPIQPPAEIAAENPRINAVDAILGRYPQVDCPVVHRHTPGLYIRECHVPAGTMLTSKIHQTEHPFVITKGHISVFIEGEGVVHYRAPFTGITRPGTRRVLFAHDDTVWTTFHPTQETDLAKIEAEIIYPHNHFMPLTDEEISLLIDAPLKTGET